MCYRVTVFIVLYSRNLVEHNRTLDRFFQLLGIEHGIGASACPHTDDNSMRKWIHFSRSSTGQSSCSDGPEQLAEETPELN